MLYATVEVGSSWGPLHLICIYVGYLASLNFKLVYNNTPCWRRKSLRHIYIICIHYIHTKTIEAATFSTFFLLVLCFPFLDAGPLLYNCPASKAIALTCLLWRNVHVIQYILTAFMPPVDLPTDVFSVVLSLHSHKKLSYLPRVI